MKYFLTFGNKRFIQSRERIVNEASQLNIFDKFIIETENIEYDKIYKDCIFTSNINSNSRGYFWYTWKPYIILKLLNIISDNDIMMYCDSGMKIYNNSTNINKFKYLFEIVNDVDVCPSGIITFITTGSKDTRCEYMWTRKEVFDYFNLTNDNDFLNSQQIQAGIIVIKKCEKSMYIIKKWFSIFKENPELFIGDPRFTNKLTSKEQFKGFKDHRHDQSIWSILCKLYNVTILQHDKNPIYQSHIRC